ncbi:MAG: HD domain-containing protein [Chloroflexota bacterium]|nr:HD domain-containing protein [Chloroflexota bacterium]
MIARDVILAWSDIVLDIAERAAEWNVPLYIVGGAVRDAFLRRPTKDVDMATPESGIKIARRLANAFGGAFYPLDEERDVGRAILDTPDGRLLIDVARLRGDLEADLRARDFTINAIAVDVRGTLNQALDPLNGIDDLTRKTIRRCSPTAIYDDPIRLLRAVRQAAQFGLRIERDTLHDVRAAAPLLKTISSERVRDEFFKLLALPKVGGALRVADSLGILAYIIPEIVPLHGLQQTPPHIYDAWEHSLAVVDHLMEVLAVISPARTDESAAQFTTGMLAVAFGGYRARLQDHLALAWADERTHRALLNLAVLLHDVGKAQISPPGIDGQRFAGYEIISATLTALRADALRLSGAEKDRLTLIVRHHMTRIMWEQEATPVNLHRWWRMMGAAGVDVVLFTLADYLGAVGTTVDQPTWLRLVGRAQVVLGAYYDDYDRIVSPPPLVTGDDLMNALNLKPGRIIGEMLDAIREAQVAGEIASDAAALTLARRLLDTR